MAGTVHNEPHNIATKRLTLKYTPTRKSQIIIWIVEYHFLNRGFCTFSQTIEEYERTFGYWVTILYKNF